MEYGQRAVAALAATAQMMRSTKRKLLTYFLSFFAS
jgi:hypothetical protein